MPYFLSIFLGTFVLEDVALAFALGLVADGKMMRATAFLACFLGISLGDAGLYIFGRWIGKFGQKSRWPIIQRAQRALLRARESELLTYSIIVSRFLPGTRIPTYLAAGFLRYSFFQFLSLTVVTVLAWVALAFVVGRSLQSLFMNHWVLTVAITLVVLKSVQFLIPRFSDSWKRRALFYTWRRALHFEFWPALVFYVPVIPMYIYLTLKHRNILAPFYANPEIENGGLIGESKWDFLKHLDPHSPATLKALKIGPQNDFIKARERLDQAGFSYPFVIKPDVGQRGFGVRIIKDDFDLAEYLLLADFPMIVQCLSRYPCEAGVFYIRKPSMTKGFLFSITDKRFPVVVGDGRRRLGDLILGDPRARIIASTYFARHREHLNEIPRPGEILALSECGNHCQGAIFLNGEPFMSSKLTDAIDRIAQNIPHFFIGRLDLRYHNPASLMAGEEFEVVEINGAGSEATHIWDRNTSLLEAYRVLFRQWTFLFEIGSAVKNSPGHSPKVHVGRFLRECGKVFFRKDPLSVSS